jgi:hypothetical protein
MNKKLIQKGNVRDIHSRAYYVQVNDVFLFTNRPFHAIAGGMIRTLATTSCEIESMYMSTLI